MRSMCWRTWLASVSVALLVAAAQPDAYLQLTIPVRAETVRVRWVQPGAISWFATDRGTPGVSASEFQGAIARAFATWEAVPSAAVAFQFAGRTSALPSDDDGRSTFGFENEPQLERVLGATSFSFDVVTGDLIEADVFFNTRFSWSTAAGGDPVSFDLQSIATHEIGHFLGLGHSALGETELLGAERRVLATGSVMFPIALGRGSIAGRLLQPDDVAGISDLYPDRGFEAATGVVQGRVRIGGQPVPGAHVVAFNPRSGVLVGGFALGEEATFQIAGLEPGPHVIRVEPLDDADADAFFTRSGIETSFQVTFHDRYLVAPAGGASASVDITVQSK